MKALGGKTGTDQGSWLHSSESVKNDAPILNFSESGSIIMNNEDVTPLSAKQT